MIARKKLIATYTQWNLDWNAPYGKEYSPKPSIFTTLPLITLLRNTEFVYKLKLFPQLMGMFAFEHNNSNRTFEYPWAFYVSPLNKDMRVVEIGGALSGFQFVLAKYVKEVVNIDPFDNAHTIQFYKLRHQYLNKAFNTKVKLITEKINDSHLEENSIDRAYCISVIEHTTDNDRKEIMQRVYRILKPKGYFILSVDLFLDIFPFSDKMKNRYGTNASIKKLIEFAHFTLSFGKKSELFGFKEFKPKKILAHLDEYLISKNYPILTQLIVLQKK